MPKIKLSCRHVDTCTPDYWGGHHLAHVSVPVHRDITMRQLRSALKSEIHDGAVSGSSDLAAAIVSIDERYSKAAHAAVARDVRLTSGRKPFGHLADDALGASAYFVFDFAD